MGRAAETERVVTLTTCVVCGRLIPAGQHGRCREHDRHRAYRSGSAWRRQSAAARAGGRCADCGAAGPLQAHHAGARLVDDIDAALRGPIVPLCVACHAARHAQRRP
jgi:hypothetical protein